VLLVEDEASVRAIAARALRKLGYTVLEASNGQEALTVAARHNGIALVVTDVVMPVMGGSALVERLRETRPDISVLFTSGYNGDATPPGSRSAPVQLLPKPYTPAQLVTRVREIIDHTPPANGRGNGNGSGSPS
jgi:CheY-like chemotaxis protein